jgi:hypothetical protein
MNTAIASVFGLAALVSASPALPARFAIVVANNQNLDPDGAPLQYADDDGVLWAQLLGAYVQKLELLTVQDDETQRFHPTTVRTTAAPTLAQLRQSLGRIFAAIDAERAKGDAFTELYFVFVGHGGLDDEGHGYLHLADAPFTRADLFGEVIGKSPAHTTHVIIDACRAYSLVAGRSDDSASARREQLESFLAGHDLEDYPSVGVLVASSPERETHEWSRWRAGVFSHQVRSALSGAADVNRDGVLEYSEVAGFVAAANSGLAAYGRSIETFAWPPQQDRRTPLVDLRQARGNRFVVLEPSLSGRLYVEDDLGVRLLDLNKDPGSTVVLALPRDQGLFVRDDRFETQIPPGAEAQRLDAPLRSPYTVVSRGATDHAFTKGLFRVAYNDTFYRGFLTGQGQLIAVGDNDRPFLSTSARPVTSDTPRPWQISAGYQLGTLPLRQDKLEQGAFARFSIAVWPWLWLNAGLEGGYTDLRGTRSDAASRVALMLGASLRYMPVDFFSLSAQGDLGYAVVSLHGATTNTDPTVGVMRAMGVVGLRLYGPMWTELAAGPAAYLMSSPNGESVNGRFELGLGLSVHP